MTRALRVGRAMFAVPRTRAAPGTSALYGMPQLTGMTVMAAMASVAQTLARAGEGSCQGSMAAAPTMW